MKKLKVNNAVMDMPVVCKMGKFYVDKEEFLQKIHYDGDTISIATEEENLVDLDKIAKMTGANEGITMDNQYVYVYYSKASLANPNSLLDPSTVVSNLRNMENAANYNVVENNKNDIHVLSKRSELLDFSKIKYTYGDKKSTVDKFLEESGTLQFLVIKDKEIVGEKYYKGHTEDTKSVSFSVAKSLTSIAFGIAMEEGYIDSVNDKVTKYIPELSNTAYDEVTLDECLCMRSGIDWHEDNNDGKQGRAFEMLEYAYKEKKSNHQYLTEMKRMNEKEENEFNYITIDTHVIEWVIKNATGRSLSQYFSEKVWTKIGAEYPAIWSTDLYGNEFSGSFFSARAKDLGKLGQMILNDGEMNGQRIISKQLLNFLVTNRYEDVHYDDIESNLSEGYNCFWWIPEHKSGVKDIMARGIFGQFIYMNFTQNVVIVKQSADFGFDARKFETLKIFRKISESV